MGEFLEDYWFLIVVVIAAFMVALNSGGTNFSKTKKAGISASFQNSFPSN
ncbi:hypothetical protein [[Lactobacillus] timonensis]|nr:hypothetical protein [[Lactobacillus] timonensis]